MYILWPTKCTGAPIPLPAYRTYRDSGQAGQCITLYTVMHYRSPMPLFSKCYSEEMTKLNEGYQSRVYIIFCRGHWGDTIVPCKIIKSSKLAITSVREKRYGTTVVTDCVYVEGSNEP